MARLVLVSVGEYGGTLPLVSIGRAARASGHEVELLSYWEFERLAREADLEFSPVCDRALNEEIVRDALLTEPTGRSPESYLPRVETFLRRYFRVINGGIYRRLAELPADSVVLSDDSPFLFADALVRSHAGTMLGRTFQEPPGVELYRLIESPKFRELVRPLLEKLMRDLLGELSLPEDRITLLEDWSLPAWYERLGIECLGFWPEWYEPAPFPALRLTGFVSAETEQPDELPRGLEDALRGEEKPVLFVAGTLGTVSGWEHTFFQASAQACRDLGRPGIFVSGERGRIPSGLGGDAFAFDFVPISRIASKLAAVVHHGGMNGCATVLAKATPQVLVPRVYGQRENAERFARLGVAKIVEPSSYRSSVVRSALIELIESEEVSSRCQRYARTLSEGRGREEACSWVGSRLAAVANTRRGVIQAAPDEKYCVNR